MPSSKTIKSVCVYCGSSIGTNSAFAKAAEELGQSLAQNGIQLIYGGGERGSMGTIARAALKAGGAVTGIIPEFLMQLEQEKGAKGFDDMELIVVPDMHTRKQMMFDKADAFVAMPGGIGTLEELVEILTWAQLGRHEKPVALLNVEDFWSPYMELTGHMEKAGFLHNPERVKPAIFDNATDVLPGLLKLV